jgi:hypothetical protein
VPRLYTFIELCEAYGIRQRYRTTDVEAGRLDTGADRRVLVLDPRRLASNSWRRR